MIDLTKFFYNQLNKHGDVGGHTDIREYVDAMTNSELLDMLLGNDWDEEPTSSNKVLLSLFMDTDDDADIMYNGVVYGGLGDLRITKQFESREDAVKHLTSRIEVMKGGKAYEFTKDWLKESIKQLSIGRTADYIAGNQTYSVSIELI
jgi:hypothetical protein